MITDDKILEIRERSSIVEVISDHLTLKKTGRNYLGLCPFHSEKTPSFTVNEEKGIFHCFGCHAGGNVFNFLMRYEHLSFPEAVERLGRRYGLQVERFQRPWAKRQAEEKEALYGLNERVATYFHQTLFGRGEGERALRYLKTRGVDEKTARRFYLGYAPPRGQGLLDLLRKGGASSSPAVRLGLVSERGPGRYAPKFFDRLMFPIIDPGGKFAGFGGRVIGDGLPKYLNSAESPIFRKGSQLYGLFHAKEAIRKTDRVVIVEGYLDVLALEQSGISYAVAALGTALTADHVRLLRRYTKNVVALFDGDDAGRKAAARSFEVFVEGGLLGRAAFLPKGEDPDSFVRSRGRQAMEAVLDQAVPLADYAFTWLQERHGRGLEGKSLIAQEVSRVLAKVQSPFEYDLLIQRAVDSLGIREELLRRSTVNQRPAVGARPNPAGPRHPQGKIREDLAESVLVTLMLRFPSVIASVDRVDGMERLVGAKWRELIQAISAEWSDRGEVDPALLARRLPPDQASELAALVLQGENLQESECDRMAADCLFYLRRRNLKGVEADLRRAIRIAEERKDEKVKKERMREWQEVVQRERDLERQKFVPRSEIR